MRPPHVLLVDDDEILLRRLQNLLVRAGFEVSSATDGLHALGEVRHRLPDIVVTDVHMPRMGGPALIEALRKLPEMADRPILVLTADETRFTKIRLLQVGADDFIVKPVDPEELVARLRAQARKSDLADNLVEVSIQRDEAVRKLEVRTRELEQLTIGLVATLEKANSYNDSDTGNHIRRVSSYAALLAEAAGCTPDFVEKLHRYAGLHDVGKVGIRDSILKKPGKLTADEFEEMKTHTLIGAELLRSAGLPDMACNIPLCHHEKFDGTGYPRGLRGEAIPLEARIVAVVDVFDALRTKRCYKPAFSHEASEAMLQEMAGKHLDNRLVNLFLALKERILQIEAQHSDEPLIEEAWG